MADAAAAELAPEAVPVAVTVLVPVACTVDVPALEAATALTTAP